MIKCVKCGQVDAIMRAGFVRNKQRFLCKACNYFFTSTETGGMPQKKRERHQTTIVDIARELGVSNSTVSRALHGHPDISTETRQLVLKMAADMDYQPNQLAYSLVKSRTNTIGLLAPEFQNPFFPNVIIGAQAVLTAAGYNLLIMQSNESCQVEISNARAMLANRIDGLLISLSHETNSFEHLTAFGKRGIPLIQFNRVSDEIAAPKVVVNDYEAAFVAVEHLILNGYQRIAHLGGPLNLSVSRERRRGYIAAMLKYGKPIEENMIIQSELTPQKATIYGNYLLDQKNRPDAVFAVNDPAAIELILVAREKGISIPDELGIVGFSDSPIAPFIEPTLTTIRQPTVEMGRVTAGLLLKLIGNEQDQSIPEQTILPTELIIRRSSVRGVV